MQQQFRTVFCLCKLPNNKQELTYNVFHAEGAITNSPPTSAPKLAIASKVTWKCPKCKPEQGEAGQRTILGAVNKQNWTAAILKGNENYISLHTLISLIINEDNLQSIFLSLIFLFLKGSADLL